MQDKTNATILTSDMIARLLGARMGPEGLRIAGIAEAIARFGLDVKDCGNLVGPANPWPAAVSGFRHLPEVVPWNQLLHDATYAELKAGRLPIMLGAITVWLSDPSAQWRGSVASRAKSCVSCGLMRTPTSTPPRSRPPK